MTFKEIVESRRAVRMFDTQKPLNKEKVKACLELASLAPSSSNMQLWEFYHITSKEIIKEISRACLNQTSTETSSQIVIFVTRQDLHRKRAKQVLEYELKNVEKFSPEDRREARTKERNHYYNFLMPFIYFRFIGIFGLFRKFLSFFIGLTKPTVRQVSECDMRSVVHKSCALAAQTFMLAMRAEGYDTCPLEGFDGKVLKRILKLPAGAEINMVVPCGIQVPEGIRGPRVRVSFDEFYKRMDN